MARPEASVPPLTYPEYRVYTAWTATVGTTAPAPAPSTAPAPAPSMAPPSAASVSASNASPPAAQSFSRNHFPGGSLCRALLPR